MTATGSGRPLLYVVRHGATEWSENGRHTGTTDLPLLPAGEDQARATGALLTGTTFDLVLCSPLQRARRTAELAGLGDRIEIEPDLVEWDYGAYEGVTTATIRETVPGWTVWNGECPDGETADQVATRVDRVIARVRAQGGTAIAFAHGHVLRVLTARWIGLDPRAGAHFLLDPATLGILGWERDTPAVQRWNAR